MTISSQTSKNTYTGNGVTTAFAFSFRILDEDHLLVQTIDTDDVVTDYTISTNYTVSGTGNTSGRTDYTSGTVTFLVAPTSGHTVSIKRGIPLLQELNYIENDNFPAESHEEAIDKLTMITQQLKEEIDTLELTGGGGGGADITDGDKGDITVSSSGTVWTIDNDAVTYAKMQNVSTTDVILGRSSSGSGNVEEITFTDFAQSLADDTSASVARTTLGLGDISVQDASNVTISGGSITGITDLAVTDGGTGASTAANARTNLGLAIGTNVQAYSSVLTDIAALTPTDNAVVIGNGSNLVVESGSTLRTSIGLAIGTDVQAYDAELAAIAGLTSAADKIPYFTGSGTAATTDFTAAARSLLDDADASTMRSTLGLAIGSNVQAYSASLTDLATNYTPASSAGQSQLVFKEDTDNGTESITLTVPASIATSRTISLPTNTPVNGYSVITDGSGNWSYSNVSGGGGGTTAGGADTQVQFNDSGTLNGDSGFIYGLGTGIATLTTALHVGGNATGPGYIKFFEDSDNGVNYVAVTAPSSLASSTSLTLPAATDTLVGKATTDTLTNKTLTSPIISTISNTGTLTLPTSTDTLVGRDTTDTLTNKTLTAPKFADGGFIADGSGNEQIKFSTTASAVNEITIKNAATTTGPTILVSGGDTNAPLNLRGKGTGVPRVLDDTDPTKIIAFSPTGASTGTTLTLASTTTGNRTVTFPDATVTLASLTGTETLTNKTLTAPKFADGGFIADANGNEQIVFTTTASAVNYLNITNAGTGGQVTVSVAGDDTDVGMFITGKGAGTITFATTSSFPFLYYSGTGYQHATIIASPNTAATRTVTLPDADITLPLNAAYSKAWVIFTGITTTAISASFNITSVTDNGAGDTTVTIATDFSSADFAVAGSAGANTATKYYLATHVTTTTTATLVRVVSSTDAGIATDVAKNSVIMYGNQ